MKVETTVRPAEGLKFVLFATLLLDLRGLSAEERSRAATVLSTVAAEIEKGEHHQDVKTLLLRAARS